MKVSDVIHGRVVTLDLRRADGEQLPDGLVAKSELFLLSGEAEHLRLQARDQVWEVEGVAPRDHDTLRHLGTRDLPRLAWLVQPAPAKGPADKVLVQVHEFPAAFVWNEPVEIGIDDKVVDDMRKRRKRLVSVESVVQWLTERILLHPRGLGGSPRALLSGTPMPDADQKTAFRLYGAGYAVDVQRGTDDRLRATRVVEARRAVEGDDRRPIYLATGQISFCDVTLAGQFRGIAQTELDNLVAQADSYLGLWREYNEKERQAVLRRARQFGWVRYSSCQQLPDGAWRFGLNIDGDRAGEFWSRLDALDGEHLQTGPEVPPAIQGVDTDGGLKGPRRPFVGEVTGRRASPPSLSLRPPPDQDDRVPPAEGFIFVSLGGDEVRIARRTAAWERIRSCTNPLPQLGMMIEGQPVPERHSRRLRPVTKAVRDVFASPNDRQRLALEVSLNTPDIALVQGPPGTGKTRVIAALQARLAEKDEGVDPDGLSGNTLLTSFQHDAVENAAAATRVMGLPAVKVGYRRGSDEVRDGVETWATETAQAVRAARAQAGSEDSVHSALQAVREIAVAYLEAPSGRDKPEEILRRVSDVASAWVPAEVAAELSRLAAGFVTTGKASLGDEDRAFALKAVRSLRVEAVPFSDDGPANAHKALRRLQRLDGFALADEESSNLAAAAAFSEDEVPPDELLNRIRSTRDALIDRLQHADESIATPRAHADVGSTIMRVVDALTARASESAPGVDVAVAQWLAALEKDPDGIREAVQHYSMVLAATCQQSVSRSMEDAKLGEDTVFRTVIVDEAARSNPLDLLIPMALGERRVILVGDHRQLPHILEPDIEREIEQSVQEETRHALRRSLFEKLFTELREREKRDGVKRTVTLNVQYRMHPLLGQFVSEQFYEPYGEGFGSGREEREFEHSVTLGAGCSLAGKVAAWIDVPFEAGSESGGRSKARTIEARRVAQEAFDVVSRHPELSVGVITFYAAQRNELFAAMSHVDLTEPDDTGGYRVRDKWRRTNDGRERLRVGTVDAFQGKEFDVVFLSLARSNRVQVKDEVSRRRRYGFLLLENRLCVAMSRQHRLLVVVGDSSMTKGPDAESSVPGLVAFRQLCEGQSGTVIRN